MQEYRAYLLAPYGQVVNRIDLVCADENTARERAQQLADDHAVELWQGERKIAEYPARRRPVGLPPYRPADI